MIASHRLLNRSGFCSNEDQNARKDDQSAYRDPACKGFIEDRDAQHDGEDRADHY